MDCREWSFVVMDQIELIQVKVQWQAFVLGVLKYTHALCILPHETLNWRRLGMEKAHTWQMCSHDHKSQRYKHCALLIMAIELLCPLKELVPLSVEFITMIEFWCFVFMKSYSVYTCKIHDMQGSNPVIRSGHCGHSDPEMWQWTTSLIIHDVRKKLELSYSLV